MVNTNKKELLKKILILIVSVLLIFAVIIILSYENSTKYPPLINNNKILTLTNNSIVSMNIDQTIDYNPNNDSGSMINQQEQDEQENAEDYIEPDSEENEQEDEQEEEPEIIYGDIKLSIVPMQDNILSGLVEINILTYPEYSEELLFMLYPKDSGDPLEDENSLIEIIEKPFELEFAIDTTEFPNGNYVLIVASTYSDAPDDNPWISTYKREFFIEN